MFTVQDQETKQERGLYIVFEGVDGSGKSTLSQLFVNELLKSYVGVFHQVFPSKNGQVGQLIRKTFTREIELSEEVLGYLMVADGLDRCDELYKLLYCNITVVCDRHPLVSGCAYQTEVWTLDELIAIQQRHRFLEPDIVFVLDVPSEVAVERIKQRHGLTNLIFEKDSDAYRERLRHRYLGYVSLHENCVLLDGTLSLDALLKTCIDIVRTRFTEKVCASPENR